MVRTCPGRLIAIRLRVHSVPREARELLAAARGDHLGKGPAEVVRVRSGFLGLEGSARMLAPGM
eukprot:6009692-Alexandrium_andersonii.AAC.1